MARIQATGPFRYSSEIDFQIKAAASEILNTKVINAEKITKGENNHVYKIDSTGGSFVARVFRHAHWPEEGKLEWVEQQLTELHVPHAKQVYYSRDDKYFPNGLMISEYIAGQNGYDAIQEGDITFEQFHEVLAGLLKQIHGVQVKAYGLVCNGEGQNPDYIGYQIGHMRKVFARSEGLPGFNQEIFNRIEEIVSEKLRRFENTLYPVLVHGDATPDNCVWTEDSDVILVDWDGAKSNIWLWDYAWITYFGSHISEIGDLEKRQKLLRDAFTKGYGGVDFHAAEIVELESTLHILQAIDLLPYYYFDQENKKAYNITTDRLSKLLGFEI